MRNNDFPDDQKHREEEADKICLNKRKTARDRARRGFTLAEMLLTVAIIGILAAFAFVAVIRYQKSLKQTELDDTAREIFVAAQNHMTVARASGNWDTYVAEAESQTGGGSDRLGKAMGAVAGGTGGPSDYDGSIGSWDSSWADGTLGKDEKHDFRYVTVSADGKSDPRILSMILPDDSIDETLRGNGNILIEYDAETATVYGVWYCKPADLKKASTGSTSIADTTAYNNKNRTSKSARMKSNPMVGYYGGAASAAKEGESENDNISAIIENDDRLMLEVAVPEQKESDSAASQRAYTVKATVTGQTSGNSREISLGTSKGIASGSTTNLMGGSGLNGVIQRGSGSSNKYRLYYYTLDSVTDGADGHFASQFCNSASANEKPLIPGENLTITVRLVYGDETEKSDAEKKDTLSADGAGKSVTLSCNSLFANGSNSGGDKGTARIAYGRHLQNLSTVVSGVNFTGSTGAQVSGSRSGSAVITKAKMLNDLDWSNMTIRFLSEKAMKRTTGSTSAGGGAGTASYSVSSYNNTWNTAVGAALTAAGNFYSISDSALTEFNGNGFAISNLQIGAASATAGSGTGTPDKTGSGPKTTTPEEMNKSEGSTCAGLFGYIDAGTTGGNTMTIQRLTLKNPTAEKAAYAGFVVGKTNRETKIQNVTVTGDTALSLTADQAAGGILGEAANSSTSILYAKVLSGKTLTIAANSGNDSNTAKNNGSNSANSNNNANAGGILGCQIGGGTGTEGTWTGLRMENCTVSVSGKANSTSANAGNADNSKKYLKITGAYSAGGVLGYCAAGEPGSTSEGNSGNNTNYAGSVTIKNCNVFGVGNQDLISAKKVAGGLAAYISSKGNLDVENDAVSMYVADSDTQGESAGTAGDGFGGLIGYLNSSAGGSQISKCYVGGRTAEGAYNETVNNNSTQGRYNIRGNGYVGGFIGQIAGSNALSVENCFTTASAYSGTTANSGNDSDSENAAEAGSFIANSTNENLSVKSCYSTGLTNGTVFVGGSVSNGGNNSPKNYYLAGVNKSDLTGAGVKKANVNDAGTPFAKQTSSVDTNRYDSSLKGKYPYQMISGQSVYYGDWVVTKAQDLDGSFGILYYEIVQHGTGSEAAKNKSVYYHGYIGNAVVGGNASNVSYKEINTRTTLNEEQSPGILNEHRLLAAPDGGEYVTEDGYLILVSEQNDLDQVSMSWVGNGVKSSISSLVNSEILIQYDDITDKLQIKGYHAYYFNTKNNEVISRENYGDGYSTTLNIDFYNDLQSRPTTFFMNPYFSDYVSTSSDTIPYYIRSAHQLQVLFELLDGGKYLSTSGNGTNVVTQTMDISFNNTLIHFTEMGKNISIKSPTLSNLFGTYKGAIKQDDQYFCLDSLTNPLINSIHWRKDNSQDYSHLENLVITNMKASSLVGDNHGVMSALQILNSSFSSAAFVSNNNSGTISNCSLDDVSTEGDGVATTNNGTISNVRIEKSYINGNGISTTNQGWNLTDKIDGCTIINTKIEKNGIVKTNQGTISNSIINNSKISMNGASYDNNGTISYVSLKNISNIDDNGVADSNNGTISNVNLEDISNIGKNGIVRKNNKQIVNCSIKIAAIKGNGVAETNTGTIGAQSEGIGVSLQSVTIGENGFVDNNSGTISNSKVINAKIDKNGVAETNTGTIGAQGKDSIGVSLQSVTIGENGFVDSNSGTISNSNVINAQIGKNGFANNNDANHSIENCQLYADNNAYLQYQNSYKNQTMYYNPNLVKMYSDDIEQKAGYNLLVCGYSNISDSKDAEDIAGFIQDNKGTINGCSYSGKVFGNKNAAGFFLNNSGTIKSSYANALVTASDIVAGFGYSCTAGKIDQCHSVGMLFNATKGAGFLYQYNNSSWTDGISNDYSAIWKSTVSNNYYFFLKSYTAPEYSNQIKNCAYLTSIDCEKKAIKESENNDSIKEKVRGYSYQDLQNLTDQYEYGKKASEDTTKPYYQYTGSNEKVYPFPMPDGMIAFGDWDWNDAIYSIKFDGNDGTPEIDGKEISRIDNIDYVIDVTLPECKAPEGQNWTFEGWQDQSGNIYRAGDKVSGLATSGTVTLTAQWKIDNVTDYYSKNEVQTYTAPADGWYKLEVWGANGGNASFDSKTAEGGKGGYAVNYVYLNKNESIDVYIGGRGMDATENMFTNNTTDLTLEGGWNGGGTSHSLSIGDSQKTSYWVLGSGGGASHMAIRAEAQDQPSELKDFYSSKDHILLVAGGGGGAGFYGNKFSKKVYFSIGNKGGNGGGDAGTRGTAFTNTEQAESRDPIYGTGGTQSTGGVVGNNGVMCGRFGLGGSPLKNNSNGEKNEYSVGAGGGGGWYGGGSSNFKDTTNQVAPSAGGGSGYFKTSNIASPITNGTTMRGGTLVGENSDIPSFDSSDKGNGHGRITYLPSYSFSITNNNVEQKPDENNPITILMNTPVQLTLKDAQNQYVNDATWKVTDPNGNEISGDSVLLPETGSVRTFTSRSAGTYVITAAGPDKVVSTSVTINVKEDDGSNTITGNAAPKAGSGKNSGSAANSNAATNTGGSTDSTTGGGTSAGSQKGSGSSLDSAGSADGSSSKKVDEDGSDESIVSSSNS
ncbi:MULTISPECIES: glycine-rich protein [unclassified Bilifractor]|uniref:glycine-rich protein n=1 Tax=unclassified Bilifractor TaxID=2815795 RepID=UPI003F934FFE